MTNIILHEDDHEDEFEDILFENTIDFFKDLNAIYIIYTLPLEPEAALEVVSNKLNKTKKKDKHYSIKNNKTSKNQKNLKII